MQLLNPNAEIRMSKEGAAQMSCLAGIGGRVKSLMSKAQSAERILVIDGCPLSSPGLGRDRFAQKFLPGK